MTLSADPRAMAWLRRARFWALALLALVVAHDAVYLATYGSEYTDAMAATGHGYWVTYVLLALVLGGHGHAVLPRESVPEADKALGQQLTQAWARAETEAYYQALKLRFRVEKRVDPLAAAAAASAAKP